MSPAAEIVVLLGGRLAVDFANAPSYPGAPFNDLSWEEFIGFLEAARIVSSERSDQLMALPETDPRSAHALLTRATHLRVDEPAFQEADGMGGVAAVRDRAHAHFGEANDDTLFIERHEMRVDGGARFCFVLGRALGWP